MESDGEWQIPMENEKTHPAAYEAAKRLQMTASVITRKFMTARLRWISSKRSYTLTESRDRRTDKRAANSVTLVTIKRLRKRK